MAANTRIIFFGTPEFAVHCLEAMVAAQQNIVAVVTAPDRKAGRGKKWRSSAVCLAAKAHGLPVLQPENLKAPEFLAALRAYDPTLMVVVAFRMLPKQVWSIPKKGCFNLHASLLPHYRGAAPINWAIINGETETGLTTFLIDKKIDTGQILLQEKIPFDPQTTAGSLHDTIATQGGTLILKTIETLETQSRTPRAQPLTGDFKLAPKLTKENTRIRWEQELPKIEALIRGLSPYPGAWTTAITTTEEFTFKIFKAKILLENHHHETGTLVLANKKIQIAHPSGWLLCEELQLPNKRRMTALELLNGYEFDVKTRVK